MEQNRIRNFCVISHVDHGKSTLADRFLEITGTIEKRKMQERFLDMHPLERERGITIKLQPVRMIYKLKSKNEKLKINDSETFRFELYTLNLIDTPGHVDFSYEVSRSLAAVEGAIILVDATQGVQAQTIANLRLAVKQGLDIIPVINKIDLPTARIEHTATELRNLLDSTQELNPKARIYNRILEISAKEGTGVEEMLQTVVSFIRPPAGQNVKLLRALIFDSLFDSYRGVIAYVRMVDGELKSGESIFIFTPKVRTEVKEVGFFTPALERTDGLHTGEIGYIATGLKDISLVRVGDTITNAATGNRGETDAAFVPLAGYGEPQALIFASIFPRSQDDYQLLRDALEKLYLQDASLQFEPQSSPGLGRGFRCGFLGLLHVEITGERLKRDFGLDIIISHPAVEYRIKLTSGQEISVRSVSELPSAEKITEIQEPWVELHILSPMQYLSKIMHLLKTYRGEYKYTEQLALDSVLLVASAPLADIIVDFYDRLKNISSGYASLSYQLSKYRVYSLMRMDVLIAGELVEPFSRILPVEYLNREARKVVARLKEVLPPQLFDVAIQAVVGGRVIARETLRARRKDVTGYLYGGDVTRKMKLLHKQKIGKKRLKQTGRVVIPQNVFWEMLRR